MIRDFVDKFFVYIWGELDFTSFHWM